MYSLEPLCLNISFDIVKYQRCNKIEVDLKVISKEQELLKELKEDRIAQVIDNAFRYDKIDYYDMCTLRGCVQTKKTSFNPLEIRWFLLNYKTWIKIIKGTKKGQMGRRIFMKFYRFGNNVHKVSKELKVPRSTIYHWVRKFEQMFLLKPLPISFHNRDTNENMLILDHLCFPKLIPLTAIYIQKQISIETLK